MKLGLSILLLLFSASVWAVPPDPTASQLLSLENNCPVNATDNTKIKNCTAVNHEDRIDTLEATGSPDLTQIESDIADHETRITTLESGGSGSSSNVQELPASCVGTATHAHGALHIMGGWMVNGHGQGDGANGTLYHLSSVVSFQKVSGGIKATMPFQSNGNVTPTYTLNIYGANSFGVGNCMDDLFALFTTDNPTIIWSGP